MIAFSLSSCKEMSAQDTHHQRQVALAHIFRYFLGDLSKLEQNGPDFFKSESISILAIQLATVHRKQFQRRKIAFNNKTTPLLLEFNSCEDTFELFKKVIK